MQNISRRHFIKSSAGAAALSMTLPAVAANKNHFLGPVELGATGVKVSRLAFGTGTHGSEQRSKQTRLGTKEFVDLAQHCFDSGIRLFDMGDTYGSHPFVREALKEIPRAKMTLLTKIWTRPSSWAQFTTAQKAVDRFRQELNVDTIDIVMIHCMVRPNWPDHYARVCDGLSELRERGVIRTFGVSCHSYPALVAAVQSKWTEVILARINNTGTLMDHLPDKVAPLLKQARENGKGIIGMKIYGGGKTREEEQRENSLQFVWNSGAVDATTIGFAKPEEVDDTLKRMQRIVPAALKLKG